MSRLRTLDSKISFFAFADIITAVSGMLIFITLLLATDLGRPTDSRSREADQETEDQIQDALRQQLEIDGQTRRLQELLAAAEVAPSSEKIEGDIAKLRAQWAEAQQKQSGMSEELRKAGFALQARDKALGLTDLKAGIQRSIEEADAVALQEAKVRKEMDSLEDKTLAAQARLLKLRERDGKVWIIPERGTTTKEPILVTVAGSGATVQSFDHPDRRKQWDSAEAQSSFKAYLHGQNAQNQYVLFLIRPSGIQLFQSLVESARARGFEVGFDALEENKEEYFSTPPPMDEPISTKSPTATATAAQGHPSTNSAPTPARPPPATTAEKPTARTRAKPPAPPPPKESWWQRLLKWLGIT